MRKDRRLGLCVEPRIKLRETLARFWGRRYADGSIERSMQAQREKRQLEDLKQPASPADVWDSVLVLIARTRCGPRGASART
jgi:hypothetical protein